MLNKIRFLVVELLVLGSLRVEAGEKFDELILIAQQNLEDWLRFVGIGNKDLKEERAVIMTAWRERRRTCLKNVEGFELNISRLFSQHVHHQLQVVWIRNVFRHHLQAECSELATDSRVFKENLP